MNGTLYSLGLLDSGIGFVTAGLIGVLFGFFLEQAGFGSSRKLTGIFYFKDMAVLKVMFTGVVVALVGYRFLVALGWLSPSDVLVLDTYWAAQIVGGLIFGVGFVMGGWCPGTAFVGMACAKLDAVVFLVGAALGSIAFNEFFPLVQPLYTGMHAGALDLPRTLGVPVKLVTFGFCIAAIVAFSGSTWVETRFGGKPKPSAKTRRHNRLAALGLVVLAAMLFALPEPTPKAAPSAIGADVAAAQSLLREVVAEKDHIEPADLADLMTEAGQKPVVVDIRPGPSYRQFHLRGAINVPLDALAAQAAAQLPRDGQVVLYSNGTTHAGQAWLELRRMGYANVRVLTDGLIGFWRECLTPPSLANLVDEQRAKAQFAEFAKRRRYFLDEAGPVGPPSRDGAESAVAKPPDTPRRAVQAAPVSVPMSEPGLAKHLVSVEWLAGKLTGHGIRILDVRSKPTDYSTAHIPGSLYLNIESLRMTADGVPSMMLPAREIAATLGRMGIANRDTVVVYADDRLQDATYVALALERVGHANYAVLHGGFVKWLVEKRPVTSELPQAKSTTYKPKPGADDFTVRLQSVMAAVRGKTAVILDVRPAAYYRGEKSDEARPGHIPGAVNREYTLDLVPDAGMWQSALVLKGEYERLGISRATPVIVHCRTGHQASQTYFLLRHLLGLASVRWYDGSWTEWAARRDLPAHVAR